MTSSVTKGAVSSFFVARSSALCMLHLLFLQHVWGKIEVVFYLYLYRLVYSLAPMLLVCTVWLYVMHVAVEAVTNLKDETGKVLTPINFKVVFEKAMLFIDHRSLKHVMPKSRIFVTCDGVLKLSIQLSNVLLQHPTNCRLEMTMWRIIFQSCMGGWLDICIN